MNGSTCAELATVDLWAYSWNSQISYIRAWRKRVWCALCVCVCVCVCVSAVCQQVMQFGRCNSNMSLTFIGPCIANIFAEYNQQDATFHNFFISVRRSYMFQMVFPSIIRSSKLHIQRQAFVRPILLPAASLANGRSDKCLTLYV